MRLHRFNHTLDWIILHGIDLPEIDIVPPRNDVTDHFLASCMLHSIDINYLAPCYHPGRTIVPTTKDRFTNNLPDLSQLLCVPINTNEQDKITSNMGTIFSNTLETVAPIKLKKVREKRAAPWYNSFRKKLGFRPHHSTETVLIKNDLLLVSDQGCISLLVLLDLTAAFDTIDHDILIDRLQNYTGIHGQALRWFRSYLSDRYHFVYLNGEAS